MVWFLSSSLQRNDFSAGGDIPTQASHNLRMGWAAAVGAVLVGTHHALTLNAEKMLRLWLYKTKDSRATDNWTPRCAINPVDMSE